MFWYGMKRPQKLTCFLIRSQLHPLEHTHKNTLTHVDICTVRWNTMRKLKLCDFWWMDWCKLEICLSVRLLPTHLSRTANYNFTDSPVIICFVDIDKCAPKKKSKSYLVCAGATVPPITVVIHRPPRLDGSGDFVFLCVVVCVDDGVLLQIGESAEEYNIDL